MLKRIELPLHGFLIGWWSKYFYWNNQRPPNGAFLNYVRLLSVFRVWEIQSTPTSQKFFRGAALWTSAEKHHTLTKINHFLLFFQFFSLIILLSSITIFFSCWSGFFRKSGNVYPNLGLLFIVQSAPVTCSTPAVAKRWCVQYFWCWQKLDLISLCFFYPLQATLLSIAQRSKRE